MNTTEAVVKVLSEAGEEDLHWTVVLDRALRSGYVPPSPEARPGVIAALAAAAEAGTIERTSKGTYRCA